MTFAEGISFGGKPGDADQPSLAGEWEQRE
jgi:hypothetical protein